MTKTIEKTNARSTTLRKQGRFDIVERHLAYDLPPLINWVPSRSFFVRVNDRPDHNAPNAPEVLTYIHVHVMRSPLHINDISDESIDPLEEGVATVALTHGTSDTFELVDDFDKRIIEHSEVPDEWRGILGLS